MKTSHLDNNEHHLIQTILEDLENELPENPTDMKHDITITIPQFTLDFQAMQLRIKDMKNPNFWLQKAIV